MAEMTVPQVDFSILGNLGNTYNEARTMSLAELGRRKAAEELAAGNDKAALAALVGSGDSRTLAALGQYQQHANSVYGTPIYGTDDKGQTRIGSFDKNGRFRPIETPGFTPTPGIKTVDTGTGTAILNARSGAPVGGAQYTPGSLPPTSVQNGPAPTGLPPTTDQRAPPARTPGYIPKDVQGEAAAKKYGTEVGDRLAELGKARSGLDTALDSLDSMRDFSVRLKNHPGLTGITGVQGYFPNWRGGKAADADATLETLKSKVGFGVLQAMREASKTGGALGNVSDAEGRRLESNLAALNTAQSPGAFKKAMDDIIRYVDGAKTRLRSAYEQDYASLRQPGGSVQRQPQAVQQPPAQAQQTPPVTKTIGGKVYLQVNGQWYEQ